MYNNIFSCLGRPQEDHYWPKNRICKPRRKVAKVVSASKGFWGKNLFTYKFGLVVYRCGKSYKMPKIGYKCSLWKDCLNVEMHRFIIKYPRWKIYKFSIYKSITNALKYVKHHAWWAAFNTCLSNKAWDLIKLWLQQFHGALTLGTFFLNYTPALL